jgi:UDP-N-acetylglucosamine 4,6-dehydratase
MTLRPLETFDGRSVFVTGGTGSFGRLFVRTLLEKHAPRRVVVFSRDELKQFEMAQELSDACLRYVIGDIRDRDRLEIALHGIDTVVHAAALKQVPTAEYNPMEAIKTNVLGAENLVNAAIAQGVERVIALSTDKAVNPINLYGATKLCADKLFIAANHLSGERGPRFSVVRYGNVIGSRGSVIPFFTKLAREGRKLPITDERMTRFWVTLGQGVAFVTRCCAVMQGGEIFLPKCPSMKIVDLARAIAPRGRLEFIGIRPGEKLHEVLVPADESRNTLEFDDMFVTQPAFRDWNGAASSEYGGRPGKPVPADFEYRSDSNEQWMTVEQLRAVIAKDADKPHG